MDMKKMMKQAQMMQLELSRAQDEIKDMRFTASAGGGMVEATAKGDNTLESISIHPDAVQMADAEMLQDMVLAAVNEALRAAEDAANANMSKLTGGLNLGGLF